jgi:hypothetical protein
MNAFAFMIDKAKVDSHNWDPPKTSKNFYDSYVHRSP